MSATTVTAHTPFLNNSPKQQEDELFCCHFLGDELNRHFEEDISFISVFVLIVELVAH